MKNFWGILICLLLLALFCAVVLTDASRHDYDLKLDGYILELKEQNAKAAGQGEMLKAQILELRAQFCKGLEEGRCSEVGK